MTKRKIKEWINYNLIKTAGMVIIFSILCDTITNIIIPPIIYMICGGIICITGTYLIIKNYMKCPACGEPKEEFWMNYCPNCGQRLRLIRKEYPYKRIIKHNLKQYKENRLSIR